MRVDAESVWARVALLALGSILALTIVEVVCRAWILPLSANWQYHPSLGWTQRPDAVYDYPVGGETIRVAFNALGFRDVEHTLAKAEGVRRIVVVGDSFSEAIQVHLEDTFYRRLERHLNAAGAQRWEVINLGVGNFGTAQALIALRELGLAYQPDVVIAQIFPLNDICNNSLALRGLCKSTIDGYRPYAVATAHGLELTSAEPVRNFLRRRSRAFALFEHTALLALDPLLAARNEAWRGAQRQALGFPSSEVLLHTYVVDDRQLPVIAQAWSLTERILETLLDECRRHDIAVVPLIVPFELRIDPDGGFGVIAGAPEYPAVRDYPERRLGDFFARAGAPAVAMLPVFEQHVDAVLPYRDGHLNPEGHRLVAAALYTRLRDMGVVERPASTSRPIW